MTSTIFVRTYTRDLPWLRWALHSIARFWAEDSKLVISCEPEDANTIKGFLNECGIDLLERTQLSHWVQWGNNKGYLFQQWQKLTADRLTDSDLIVFFDSDLLFNRVTSLEDFMDPEKKRLRVFYEPYPSVEISEPGAASWLRPTWKAMQVRPEWEFMRRHPFIFWRDTITRCREYLENLHGPLHEWLINLGSGTEQVFSEFNCIGFYAWLHETDRYWFLNVKEYEKLAGAKYGPQVLSENPVEQFHSWTGLPEQAHGRFLQACERADYLVKLAYASQAKTELDIAAYVAKKDQAENAPPAPDGPSEETKIIGWDAAGKPVVAPVERSGDAEPTQFSEGLGEHGDGEGNIPGIPHQSHAGLDPAAEGEERSSVPVDPYREVGMDQPSH